MSHAYVSSSVYIFSNTDMPYETYGILTLLSLFLGHDLQHQECSSFFPLAVLPGCVFPKAGENKRSLLSHHSQMDPDAWSLTMLVCQKNGAEMVYSVST